MSISEKLRQAFHNDLTDCPILLDAADEIERLERERDALREALVAAHHEASCCDDIQLDQTLAGIISDLQRAREKAEQERDDLREALERIATLDGGRLGPFTGAVKIARAALEAKP